MRGLEGELVLSVSIEPVFLLNFAVDLAWLWATGTLAGIAVRRKRLVLAAAVGAAGAVWSYFPSGRWLAGWGMLPGSLVLLAVAYGPRRFREWMRLGAYLLFTGAAMAGSVLLLGARGAGPARAAAGVVPAPAGTAAAAGILLCLVGIRRLWDAARERARLRSGLHGLRITQDGRSVEVMALLDTGNSLRDPLTGIPVVVLEASALAGVLPPPVLAAVAAGWQGLDGLPEGWKVRLRLVPFRSVGRPDGFLLAFVPDQLAVRASSGEEWVTVSALVGLAPHPLHQEGAYRALLPPSLLQGAVEVPGKTGEGETG
ncbi:MAG TPA: sigma-E processing peptidase SpoIIGA [Symbiobacteriaceae bacterium]